MLPILPALSRSRCRLSAVTARLGVDIGGTFTDLVVIDETSGAHERRLAALVREVAPQMAVPAPSARTSSSRGRVLATGSIRQGDPVRLLGQAEPAEVTATAR